MGDVIMFRIIINEVDHGTVSTVTEALMYIENEINDDELETIDADSLSIQILK